MPAGLLPKGKAVGLFQIKKKAHVGNRYLIWQNYQSAGVGSISQQACGLIKILRKSAKFYFGNSGPFLIFGSFLKKMD